MNHREEEGGILITFPPGGLGSDEINIYKASLRWGGVGENLQLLDTLLARLQTL